MNTKKLKELALAATPGPWRVEDIGECDLPNHAAISSEKHGWLAQVVWKMEDDEKSPACEATAAYIAAANPAAILELIAERDELLVALEQLFSLHEPEGRFQPSHFKPILKIAKDAIDKAKAGAV